MGAFFETINDFLHAGGNVLTVIFLASLLLWTVILERFLFFKFSLPKLTDTVVKQWELRRDKGSWFAHRIRDYELSKASTELNKNISLIKTLVALAPLLGLLGTVTGMIAVFDVMAATGTGDARSMASGISMATIPTMAGMVVALSGLFFSNIFESKARKGLLALDDGMPLDH